MLRQGDTNIDVVLLLKNPLLWHLSKTPPCLCLSYLQKRLVCEHGVLVCSSSFEALF
jgi:hypothetical protein